MPLCTRGGHEELFGGYGSATIEQIIDLLCGHSHLLRYRSITHALSSESTCCLLALGSFALVGRSVVASRFLVLPLPIVLSFSRRPQVVAHQGLQLFLLIGL